MSYTYDQRKRPQGPENTASELTSASGPSMDALMSGAIKPTAAQKGRSFDLDEAMKAKMENAFGDLSGVKFYESRAVAQAGAEAIAQGNEIAFAPGMADFSTRSGQERLGHELSHVMSQRSGQVRGSGFLNNAALEARADREGAMAAAGDQVYSEPVTQAMSAAGPSPLAAGAMQAKKRNENAREVKEMQNEGALSDGDYALPGSEGYEALDPTEWQTETHRPNWFSRNFRGKKEQEYKFRKNARAERQTDKLLAIIAGESGDASIDPEDMEYYHSHVGKSSKDWNRDDLTTMYRRRVALNRARAEKRKNANDAPAEQLDLEALMSKDSMEDNLLEIGMQRLMTPMPDRVFDATQEHLAQSVSEEDVSTMAEGKSFAESAARNAYASSKEGDARYALFLRSQNAAWADRYNEMRKKRWWKKLK